MLERENYLQENYKRHYMNVGILFNIYEYKL